MTNSIVSWDAVDAFMQEVFVRYGVPKEDARICADVLLEAERRGIKSHGLNRFKPIYLERLKAGVQKPITEVEVVRQTPATAVVDGHDGMGMVVGRRAMAMAIEKAKQCGLGMVAARGSTHFGIAGYYVTMATDEGLIGFTGTNARPSIAPTFGVENMLGTNPLTFGMPTDEPFPFVLDCATSTTQRAQIEQFVRRGEETPAGMVISRSGETMTDSNEILQALTQGKAALTPLGGVGGESAGFKGYGYATVVEILSSALQSGRFLTQLTGYDAQGNRVPYGLGHFFLAINPEAFMGLDAFRKTTGDILRTLRASQKAPGHDRIYTAGEKEYLHWQEWKDKGLPLAEAVLEEMRSVRDELSLCGYDWLDR